MFGFGILSCIVFLPLVGAGFILALRGTDEATLENARRAALGTTLIVFLLSLYAYAKFDPSSSAFQFVEEKGWFGHGLVYKMGVDGISFPFVLLTTFLMPFCILASWKSIQIRRQGIYDRLPRARDADDRRVLRPRSRAVLSFLRGRPHSDVSHHRHLGRQAAGLREFQILSLYARRIAAHAARHHGDVWRGGTTDIVTLLQTHFPSSMQKWLWLAFFASFAVKMPMWPVHTWLPDAHVEAPTAGSVILAAILLKMGGYGFIRFSLPMFPEASAYFAPLVFALSVIAIIYTSLVALVQEDMKKLIAYSSVAHMGFVTMGLFSMTPQGVQGAVFQMISHGLVSGALFLCVGVVYDRMHTRDISAYGGLVARMPLYATVFMIFTLANVGLPGTSGFIGEFLTLLGAFRVNSWVAFLRHHRRYPVGRLCALSLSAHHLRRPRQTEPCDDPRSVVARGRAVRAACRSDDLLWRSPGPGSRQLGRLDQRPHQKL